MASKKPLSQVVAEKLFQDITVNKIYAAGEKLPNENELSEKYGVSRATLREAERILVARGNLEIHRGIGTFVSEHIHRHSDTRFQEIVRNHKQILEMYEARVLLEPKMAKLACMRASDEELEEILEIGKSAEKTVLNNEDAKVMDQEFHAALVKAAHNDFLAQFIPLILDAIAQFIELTGGSAPLGEIIVDDHRRIMEFLAVRDAEGVENAMAVHMRRSMSRLEKVLETYGSSSK